MTQIVKKQQPKVEPFVYRQVPVVQLVLVAVDPTGTFGIVRLEKTRIV